MLFVNIGYMSWYKGQTAHDKIRHGGSYIHKHKTGGEVYNFRKRRGFYCGFIPPSGDVVLTRLGAAKACDSIDGVVIVWVAKSVRGSMIVGWYKNARVFRHAQSDKTQKYSAKASIQNSKLLNLDERFFRVPRGSGGMGQSPKWYADQLKDVPFVRRVWQYINSSKSPKAHKIKALGVSAWQQDQKKRAKVEEAAMKATEAWYQGQEYSTRRVDRERFGWDLEAVFRAGFFGQ